MVPNYQYPDPKPLSRNPMRHIYLIYTLSLLPLLFSSCESDGYDPTYGDDRISFVAGVPGVTSRANYDLGKMIPKEGITISAISADGAAGFLPVHFEGQIVKPEVDGLYRSDSCRWPGNSGDPDGHLRFFAFHPSHFEMRSRAGVGTECFGFSNSSKKDASGISYDYRLTRFRVAPDIAQQVDFVTAIGEGTKTLNLYSDIELNFEHQLCGVDIAVWGAPTLYDIEIAGVRIGGTIVEADFGLSTVVAKPAANENTIGEWFPASFVSGHVDYVFTDGDNVVGINAKEHNTKDRAASIMGNGGKAMVIPFKHHKWDYKNDPANNGEGMYFSALIRMTEREGDQHVIYPSTDPDSKDYIVFLLVNKSDGKVIKRLSKNEYLTTTPPPGQEKRAYGWAAVPVNVDWKPGFTYSYTLDFSKGVGVHDPVDPNPASPISDSPEVEVFYTDGTWGSGEVIQNGDWGANTNNTAPDGTVWWK